MTNKIEPGRMTPGEIECLTKVVNYLFHDEEKHYLEYGPEGREDHIFKSVFVLDGVVNRQPD